MKTIQVKNLSNRQKDIQMTYKQLDYITDLLESRPEEQKKFSENINGSSKFQMFKKLTKSDASEIIEALKSGEEITYTSSVLLK